MNYDELLKVINVVGDKGLLFFALYVVYYYLGKILGLVVILRVIKFISVVVDKWVERYFEFKDKSNGKVEEQVSEILKRIGENVKREI